MKALKFSLSGKCGFFKNPQINEKINFTFEHIHKIALFGIIGSVIGLDGYNSWNLYKTINNTNDHSLEFYEQLKNLKVSIVPKNKNGYINKKIIEYVDSSGTASKENGSLLVKEQVLFSPIWDIYLLEDDFDKTIFKKIKDYFLNNKSIYNPYLGRNNYPAKIYNVEYIELEKINKVNNISSLFIREDILLENYPYDDFQNAFLLDFMLPIDLDYNIGYLYKQISFTNLQVSTISNLDNIFKFKNNILYFF